MKTTVISHGEFQKRSQKCLIVLRFDKTAFKTSYKHLSSNDLSCYTNNFNHTFNFNSLQKIASNIKKTEIAFSQMIFTGVF